jgi:hypothetical protein
MAEKKFTFYGVDNGEAVVVTLDDVRHVMFGIKQKAEDSEESDKTADVHASLLKTLPKIEGSKRRHLSVFCLSHSHSDHCQGIERVFKLPSIKQDESDDLIEIDELWVTAAIFTDEAEGPVEHVRKEAKRRLKLYADPESAGKAKERGNMLVVFGRNDAVDDLKKLPKNRNPTAGEVFQKICGEDQSDWEAFVHCPSRYVIREGSEEKVDANNSSLILQAMVKEGSTSARFLTGGDAGCTIWKTVNKKTKENKNSERLKWDVFLVPHHGSYKFFTEKDHDEGRKEAENEPDQDAMEILDRGEGEEWIVCSSRPVKEGNYDDKDPPHIEAVCHYREQAGEDRFVCLMEHPSRENPDPLVLRITENGLQKKALAAAAISTGGRAAATPKQWG